jgi:hypothetical protein
MKHDKIVYVCTIKFDNAERQINKIKTIQYDDDYYYFDYNGDWYISLEQCLKDAEEDIKHSGYYEYDYERKAFDHLQTHNERFSYD